MDKEYIVVQSADRDTLEDKVDNLLKNGYGVYGPLQILVHKDELTWVQVVMKRHTQNIPGYPGFIVPKKKPRG